MTWALYLGFVFSNRGYYPVFNENWKCPKRLKTLILIKYGALLETGEEYCARAENEEWTRTRMGVHPFRFHWNTSLALFFFPLYYFLFSTKVKYLFVSATHAYPHISLCSLWQAFLRSPRQQPILRTLYDILGVSGNKLGHSILGIRVRRKLG